jgi:hypothetical protein
MGYLRARLAQWGFTARLAWSCLQLQLRAYQEEFTVYLPDDATPDELSEMAEHQRELAAENRRSNDLLSYARAHVTSPGAHALLDEVERGRQRRAGQG